MAAQSIRLLKGGAMRGLLGGLDRILETIVDELCTILMVMLTLVVLYTVIMRYVFLAPPFWGDVVAVLTNVSIVLLGIGLSVRKRDLVAMRALYAVIPSRLALTLELVWDVMILVFALLFTWYGYETAQAISGEYWELGMLPRRYTMMILPIGGALLIIASIKIIREDIRRLRDPTLLVQDDDHGRSVL
jgi:TRAP-type C4-dicarboxylate transport system permease small subunit